MGTLVWIIEPSAPERLFVALKKAQRAGEGRILKVMLAARKRGWVSILGAREGSVGDTMAVIQEHFNTKRIGL